VVTPGDRRYAVARVRVHTLAVSLDGHAAGAHQSVAAPVGAGGEALHAWIFRRVAAG